VGVARTFVGEEPCGGAAALVSTCREGAGGTAVAAATFIEEDGDVEAGSVVLRIGKVLLTIFATDNFDAGDCEARALGGCTSVEEIAVTATTAGDVVVAFLPLVPALI
jgi:hypothetical protein